MRIPFNSRDVTNDSGQRLFVWAWLGTMTLGCIAYIRGFSPSPALYAVMIILGMGWVVALFAVIGVPLRRIVELSPKQYLFLVALFISTALASGYVLGWTYTENWGLRSSSTLRVIDKRISWGRYRHYEIRLSVAEIIPTYHTIDKQKWDRLKVGDFLAISLSWSMWGISVDKIYGIY
jgi:hypothetical protein